MTNRKSLVSTLWLATSLALLAAVLVVPIRTSGLVAVSSRPDGLHRNFALPVGQPETRLGAALATNGAMQVNALPSENEDQNRADALDEPPEVEEQEWADAPDEPRVSFLIPCSFRKLSDHQLIAPRSILSHCPLRC